MGLAAGCVSYGWRFMGWRFTERRGRRVTSLPFGVISRLIRMRKMDEGEGRARGGGGGEGGVGGRG